MGVDKGTKREGGVAVGQREKPLFIFRCLECSVLHHASLCVCTNKLTSVSVFQH